MCEHVWVMDVKVCICMCVCVGESVNEYMSESIESKCLWMCV